MKNKLINYKMFIAYLVNLEGHEPLIKQIKRRCNWKLFPKIMIFNMNNVQRLVTLSYLGPKRAPKCFPVSLRSRYSLVSYRKIGKFIRELRGLANHVKATPTINYGSIMFMRCVGINNDYTMSVPLQILKPLAGDFDGVN